MAGKLTLGIPLSNYYCGPIALKVYHDMSVENHLFWCLTLNVKFLNFEQIFVQIDVFYCLLVGPDHFFGNKYLKNHSIDILFVHTMQTTTASCVRLTKQWTAIGLHNYRFKLVLDPCSVMESLVLYTTKNL